MTAADYGLGSFVDAMYMGLPGSFQVHRMGLRDPFEANVADWDQFVESILAEEEAMRLAEWYEQQITDPEKNMQNWENIAAKAYGVMDKYNVDNMFLNNFSINEEGYVTSMDFKSAIFYDERNKEIGFRNSLTAGFLKKDEYEGFYGAIDMMEDFSGEKMIKLSRVQSPVSNLSIDGQWQKSPKIVKDGYFFNVFGGFVKYTDRDKSINNIYIGEKLLSQIDFANYSQSKAGLLAIRYIAKKMGINNNIIMKTSIEKTSDKVLADSDHKNDIISIIVS